MDCLEAISTVDDSPRELMFLLYLSLTQKYNANGPLITSTYISDTIIKCKSPCCYVINTRIK